MNIDLTVVRDVIGYAALVVGAILVLKSKVKTDNLNDLKERVGILEKEREESRTQHLENQKAISNLEGQLKTYKEIPLKQIANSLTQLSSSNEQIINVLQGSALIAANDRDILTGSGNQTVKEMTVEHQTIKN